MMTTTAEVLLDDVTKKVTDATGRGAKLTGDEVTTCCPAHDDASPSLSLSIGRDRDRVIVHCHGPCETEAVVGAVGLTMADLFVPDDPTGLWPTTTIATPPEIYDYHDADGALVGQVVRKPGKKFVQRRPDGNGGWTWKGFGRRLYRLPALIEAVQSGRHVFVVEGEKDADRLVSLGLVATTCNQGAGKWPDDAAGHFTGAHVAIIGDNDEAGRLHAAQVATALLPAAAAVKVVALDGLGPHGDVSDWLDAGHDRDDLTAAVVATEALTDPPDPAAPVDERPSVRLLVRTAAEVTPTVVSWLWDDRLAYGKLNIIGGPPGVGKSYITTALAAAVSRGARLPGDPRPDTAPARTVMLSFEDDAGDTLRPRLDMLGADLDLVDLVEGVDDDGRRRGFGPEDVAMLAAHATRRDDVALVVVDPVSAFVGAGTDEHRGNEVRAALEDLRVLAAEHGFAVVLVMHTRKSVADTALNRLAGSQAYGALVRSALMAGPIPDTDDDRHALAHVKHNLAPKQPTLAYRVNADGLTWEGEIDLDPEEVAGNDDTGDRSAIDEAKAFLYDLLADGPVPFEDVAVEAKAAGVAEKTLRRAKKAIGVDSERTAAGWSWTPPTVPESRGPTGRDSRWPTVSGEEVGHLDDLAPNRGESPDIDGSESPQDSRWPKAAFGHLDHGGQVGPPLVGGGKVIPPGDHPTTPSTSATCVGCGTDGATLDSAGRCLACCLADVEGAS